MTTNKSVAQKSQKDRLIDKKMKDLAIKKDPKGGKNAGDKSCGGEKGCGSRVGAI